MRKFVAIAFIFLYMFSATEIHQLLKINILLEHFSEHQSKNKTITFLDFLYQHYKTNSKDADYDKDMKLPFKTTDNCAQNIFISLVTNTKIEFKPLNFPIDRKTSLGFYQSFFSTTYLDSIWQPPQFS